MRTLSQSISGKRVLLYGPSVSPFLGTLLTGARPLFYCFPSPYFINRGGGINGEFNPAADFHQCSSFWVIFIWKHFFYIWKSSRNDGGNLQNIFKYHFGLKTTLKSQILDLDPELWTSPPP